MCTNVCSRQLFLVFLLVAKWGHSTPLSLNVFTMFCVYWIVVEPGLSWKPATVFALNSIAAGPTVIV